MQHEMVVSWHEMTISCLDTTISCHDTISFLAYQAYEPALPLYVSTI